MDKLSAPSRAMQWPAHGAKTRHFSRDGSEKLARLAKTAVQILRMRRRVKEVRKLALIDGHTGISDRITTWVCAERTSGFISRISHIRP